MWPRSLGTSVWLSTTFIAIQSHFKKLVAHPDGGYGGLASLILPKLLIHRRKKCLGSCSWHMGKFQSLKHVFIEYSARTHHTLELACFVVPICPILDLGFCLHVLEGIPKLHALKFVSKITSNILTLNWHAHFGILVQERKRGRPIRQEELDMVAKLGPATLYKNLDEELAEVKILGHKLMDCYVNVCSWNFDMELS